MTGIVLQQLICLWHTTLNIYRVDLINPDWHFWFGSWLLLAIWFTMYFWFSICFTWVFQSTSLYLVHTSVLANWIWYNVDFYNNSGIFPPSLLTLWHIQTIQCREYFPFPITKIGSSWPYIYHFANSTTKYKFTTLCDMSIIFHNLNLPLRFNVLWPEDRTNRNFLILCTIAHESDTHYRFYRPVPNLTLLRQLSIILQQSFGTTFPPLECLLD